MIERPTPETDARTYIPLIGASTVPAEFARKLERERDDAREQNAKLRNIAERAIKAIKPERYGDFSYAAEGLRAELNQLKEGVK